ncbi:outer membrane receptor for ferrienterochelin and colicin [Hymenobacter luteus]|uniref:Outer membrane receptor for ferrienterochelin and colicin n=2 Tax=Hymenobacter TaxID=89966 RepID=A0A7W9WBB9_9BACT|nr:MULTISPECIES: TonB-dependent receptor [Hymenobacter]MBB4600955.1 outer membrane receptor for ferrienterochelin and colicin [Hymenobacter latericoloratus]MBB6058838.1 outer membrane receptor for ferrienterochelin and colicin [Hymenobacter luteus]
MNTFPGPGRLLTAASFVLGSALAAAAQTPDASTAPVRGQVLDGTTNSPVPGAVVRWLSAPTTAATTDSQGSFSLARPAGSDARLIINFLGYLPDTVQAPGSSYLRIPLRRSAELGEVTVEGRAPSYSGLTPTNTQVITSRDLTKSACCNLAESFETNASVEVSTTDAVSGAKQIQLLGLDGAYSLLTIDNQPALRGLASPYRLGYLAGPWIESIDIIKGMGSVVNGYESISGQVNVRLKEPDKAERLLFNAYGNDLGKFDLNLNLATPLSKKVSTALLLHTDHLGRRVDRNKDGFLDLPLATQYNLFNKWKYLSGNGLVMEVGVGALRETRQGGQLGYREDNPGGFYGTTQETNRYTGYAKTSYTWPGRPYQSLGLMLSGTDHDFTSRYGVRTYDGTQRTGQATLLFQSIIGTTAHTYRAGLSFLHDDYHEVYKTGFTYPTETPAQRYAREHRNRLEQVPGAFTEYTYQNSRNLTVVGGLRLDRHNLYGWYLTPRLNVKYDPAKNTVLRLAAGRGFRTANPIAENSGMLVSSREFVISPVLRPETAWNVGGSFTQYFNAFGRPGTFITDYYHTEFQNQVVADPYTNPEQLIITNLDVTGGRSYSRSFQAEVQVEPVKGLHAKAAYKYLDVKTTYAGELLPKVLTPRHRLFLNLGYATAFDKWRADFTVQGFGKRPLAHAPGSEGHLHGSGEGTLAFAPRYALLNTQLTRAFKRFEVYAGVENLTNYRQRNPIQGAYAPFGPDFDAAMIWGPIYGRLTYAGLRFTIN